MAVPYVEPMDLHSLFRTALAHALRPIIHSTLLALTLFIRLTCWHDSVCRCALILRVRQQSIIWLYNTAFLLSDQDSFTKPEGFNRTPRECWTSGLPLIVPKFPMRVLPARSLEPSVSPVPKCGCVDRRSHITQLTDLLSPCCKASSLPHRT